MHSLCRGDNWLAFVFVADCGKDGSANCGYGCGYFYDGLADFFCFLRFISHNSVVIMISNYSVKFGVVEVVRVAAGFFVVEAVEAHVCLLYFFGAVVKGI